MKLFFTSFCAFMLLLNFSCVDDNYNFDDYNDDNIGLGDSATVVTAPIGDITISLEDILEDYTRVAKEYTLIDQYIKDTISMSEGWLSQEVQDLLVGGSGTVCVTLSCDDFPAGLPDMTAEVWLDDVALFEGEQTINEQNTTISSKQFDNEGIKDIAAASELIYEVYFSEKTFTCDLDEVEDLVLKLAIVKTGPIAL